MTNAETEILSKSLINTYIFWFLQEYKTLVKAALLLE